MITINNLSDKTSKEFIVNFGKAVKEERIKQKLTQKELAEKVGVSHEWICKIEKGKARTISLELLHEIKNELKLKELKL